MTVTLDSETDLNWLNEIEDGGREAARGLGLPDDAPEWERAFHGLIEHALWSDDASRDLLAFGDDAVPQFVIERLREALLGGALFSDFETVPDAARESVRETMLDSLEERHGWSVESIRDNLQDAVPSLERSEAEVIARSELQSTVATAREEGYREQFDLAEERFDWVGPDDARNSEECPWIKAQIPEEGVRMDRLKELIQQAPDAVGSDLSAREWSPHPQCRHQPVRVVG